MSMSNAIAFDRHQARDNRTGRRKDRLDGRYRKPESHILDVTPAMAAKWLEKNSRNRNVRQVRVEQYARDMAAGQWKFTGDSIRFDRDGVMLDGQHRCQAIVRAGVSVRMSVMFNLDPSAQDAMDIGATRKLGDQFAIAGHRNGALTAAILRRLVAYEAGRGYLGGSKNPTHAEMHAFYDAHAESVQAAVEVGQKARQYRAQSVIGMAYHVCAQLDRGAADQFFLTQLIDGIGLATGDPARVLAKRLLDMTTARGRTHDEDMLRLIFAAWNVFRDGRSVRKLQAPKGGWTAENFPTPR